MKIEDLSEATREPSKNLEQERKDEICTSENSLWLHGGRQIEV